MQDFGVISSRTCIPFSPNRIKWRCWHLIPLQWCHNVFTLPFLISGNGIARSSPYGPACMMPCFSVKNTVPNVQWRGQSLHHKIDIKRGEVLKAKTGHLAPPLRLITADLFSLRISATDVETRHCPPPAPPGLSLDVPCLKRNFFSTLFSTPLASIGLGRTG